MDKGFSTLNRFTVMWMKRGTCVILQRKDMKCNMDAELQVCLKTFKSNCNALSQATLKTCLASKWIWGEHNKVFFWSSIGFNQLLYLWLNGQKGELGAGVIFHDSVLYQWEMKELKGNCVCSPFAAPSHLTADKYATGEKAITNTTY